MLCTFFWLQVWQKQYRTRPTLTFWNIEFWVVCRILSFQNIHFCPQSLWISVKIVCSSQPNQLIFTNVSLASGCLLLPWTFWVNLEVKLCSDQLLISCFPIYILYLTQHHTIVVKTIPPLISLISSFNKWNQHFIMIE